MYRSRSGIYRQVRGSETGAAKKNTACTRKAGEIVAELEQYGKEIPLVERLKELQKELDDANKLNKIFEWEIKRLQKQLEIERRGNLSLDAQRQENARLYSECRE
jgi:hypothetical protein